MNACTPAYLTTSELAELLRIKGRKVYEMASSGKTLCTLATGKLLFAQHEIDAWLSEQGSYKSAQKATNTSPAVFPGSHDPLLDWALKESACRLASNFDGSMDGSDCGKRALRAVVAQAKLTHSDLVLAYVIDWSPYSFHAPQELEERHQRRKSEIEWANESVLAPEIPAIEAEMGQTIYKIMFCAFVALGCVVQLGPILDISDALVFLICVPNILGLCFLAPIVKREMNSYFARIESGEIRKFK